MKSFVGKNPCRQGCCLGLQAKSMGWIWAELRFVQVPNSEFLLLTALKLSRQAHLSECPYWPSLRWIAWYFLDCWIQVFISLWDMKPTPRNFKSLIRDNKGQINKAEVAVLGAWWQRHVQFFSKQSFILLQLHYFIKWLCTFLEPIFHNSTLGCHSIAEVHSFNL